MVTLASPISRDGFIYHSILFADAGNLNHHPRASIAELTSLLRPELSSFKSNEPVKDQVGHWYTAQLIHYGLSTSKDKNTAKMRLLKALNDGTLEVPASVVRLEAQLKKDWESENRKLKKAMKSGRTEEFPIRGKDNAETNKSVAKKRKAREESGRNIGPAATKKAKLKKNSDGEHGLSYSTTGSGSAAGSKEMRSANPPGGQNTQKLLLIKEPIKEPTKKLPVKKELTKKLPVKKELAKEELTKKESTKKESTKKEPTKKEPTKKEPTKKEPTKKQSTKKPSITPLPMDKDYNLRRITGAYNVTCPVIEEEWPNVSSNLRLQLCKDGERMWGSGSWGPMDLVIQLNPGPTQISDVHPVSFGWRMRENETGETRFGGGCNGHIYFLEDDKVQGVFFGLYGGNIEFEGVRRPGPLSTCGKPAESFRHDWDEFVEEIYDGSYNKNRGWP
ncbi:hypothetical protein K432DRAFT_178753 [Lepidopterella palustris CBS 459.81]|uniref:Uncharacterized protein n=1 Tax=Lepidopterella palustris CBS 459.81 TaxID=1314670 RepID=A0A8E2JI56_9PEZI|nr:hypothetical protein K432DRAFT_178753 [Lepidopterella palustris CBS 459.81]